MRPTVNVPVVLQGAWVLEDLATLVTGVATETIRSDVEGFAHAIVKFLPVLQFVLVVVHAISAVAHDLHVAH